MRRIRLLTFTQLRTPSAEVLSSDTLYLPSKIILLKALMQDLKEDVFLVRLPPCNSENCPGSFGYTYAGRIKWKVEVENKLFAKRAVSLRFLPYFYWGKRSEWFDVIKSKCKATFIPGKPHRLL